MGLMNWTLNRTQTGRNITVKATTPYGLDNEVAKYEKKGYVRVGAPYTGKSGAFAPSEYYQSMAFQGDTEMAQTGNTTTSNTSMKPKGQGNGSTIGWVVFLVILVIAFPWLLIIVIPVIGFVIYRGIKGRNEDIVKSSRTQAKKQTQSKNNSDPQKAVHSKREKRANTNKKPLKKGKNNE